MKLSALIFKVTTPVRPRRPLWNSWERLEFSAFKNARNAFSFCRAGAKLSIYMSASSSLLASACRFTVDVNVTV